MKLKTIYVCNSCGSESSKWLGKCPECNAWNSFSEDVVNVGKTQNSLSGTPRSLKIEAREVKPLQFSKNPQFSKSQTGIVEFDRVMGNGIVPGSLTLLSGEPGIGKSTLVLQIANNISQDKKILLISGEESIEQIAERAERLKANSQNLLAINEFNLETILETIAHEKPALAIIDSIQVISSLDIPGTAGSVTQVRYCAERLMELAKTKHISIMLIGHVTKDGSLAGPKILEHLVDTVLQLEGDPFQQFRILRASKNRFGSCSEVGIFEMTENGLQEVKNPSEQFLSGRKNNAIGSTITAAMEGTRPFLVEVQALVTTTHFGYPKRTAHGFDLNRLQILVAVLEKYCKLNFQNQDIFINVVGGIKLNEPATDLAIVMAIMSSFFKKPLPEKAVIYGEVGLSGELRKISFGEHRRKECEKIGFNEIISPEKFKEITSVLNFFR